METNSARHIRIYEEAKSARSALESYWQTLMYYYLPRKAYILRNKSMGDKLPIDIYDSTGILSNAYFAAGMQAYMSGPQTRWHTIGIRNRAFMSSKSVLDYLRDTEDVLYSIINDSNFYQEDVEGYLGHGSIGIDILYGEEDLAKETVSFDSLNIENVIILCDAQGNTNRAYIEYGFNAEQAIGKFGKGAVGLKVNECYEKSDFSTKFKYLFCVYPREVYDQGKKDAKNMPFAAAWIDRERKQEVREGGYRRFPFFVSRFAKSKGDPYAYSPGMNVLADTQMINEMEHTNILAGQNAVAPALEIPDEAFLKPYNFNPRGRNIKNAGYPNEHIVPINMGGNVKIGLDYVQYKQGKIQQAFYNDLFLAIEQIGKMTATEVSIRNNQRMQLLGSAIGNIMRGKLSPMIEWVYDIAARNGKLPKLPPELIGQEYVIEYISPLARAQKSLELNNLTQAMQIISSFGSVEPSVFDKIDFDELVDYTAEITNITPKVIRDDTEVEDIRTNRAQQEAMRQQILMLQSGAEAAKTGGEADKAIAESQAVGAGVK